MILRAILPLPLLLALVSGALEAQAAEPLFEAGLVRIEAGGTVHGLRVEVARSAVAREQGLMGRESLGEDEGMIFLFERERPPNAGFYMYRTLIPLDIAYVGNDGRIVSIVTMEPCTRPVWFCEGYPPGAPYWMALEVNAGYFSRQGIGVGDRLVFEPLPPESGSPERGAAAPR
jgi:uncharacterized protein